MPAAHEIFRRQWALGLLPDEKLSLCDWIEEHILLSEGETNSPGPYRFRRTPYLRAVLEALSPDSPVQRVVAMKGGQLGWTIGAAAYVGFLIAQAPRTILFVSPTVDLAKRASRRKVGPVLEKTEIVRERLRDLGPRQTGNTTLLKEFPGGALLFAGANSGAGLRQTSAAVAILDEVDIYPASLPGEGDPVILAERATKTFPRRKHLYISTPTLAGRSRVEELYSQSDQSRYFVPCPECGHFQVLVFRDRASGRRGIEWAGAPPKLRVWYSCEACAAKIDEGKKAWMLERGEWRAKVKALSDHFRGFQISSLYASPGTFSWRDVVEQFLAAKDDVEKLRVFVNQVLGETWEERGDAPPWEELYRRREKYRRGRVPAGGLVLTAGADVQRDRIEVEIVAWGKGLESWSVDYLVIPGDSATEAPWKELDRLLTRTWPHERGVALRLRALAVDSGFETQGVYNWTRRKPADSVFAVKGSDSLSALVGQPSYVDFTWRGRKAPRAIRLWHVGSSVAKRELYGWLRLAPPLHPERGEAYPRGFLHFPEYDEEYFRQLTAEQLVARERRGDHRITYGWSKKHARNESLDARNYARAAAAIIGLDRYSDEEWQRVAEELKPKPLPTPPPAPRVRTPSRYSSSGMSIRDLWRSRHP